jgi:hypothetical protein
VSDVAQPTYSIAANLRWFAAVYVASVIVLSFAVNLLRTVGVDLPSAGLDIGVFVALTYVAGGRFAARRAWTGADRHTLALGYAAVAILLACARVVAVMLIDPTTRSMVVASGQTIAIALAVVVALALLYYGMARLMLMLLARRGKQQ